MHALTYTKKGASAPFSTNYARYRLARAYWLRLFISSAAAVNRLPIGAAMSFAAEA